MSFAARTSPPTRTRAASELARDARTLRAVGGRGLIWIMLALRLPQVLAPLGVMTWVAAHTQSAWTAALSAAAMSLGSALCGILMAYCVNTPWRQWGLLALTLVQGGVMWLLPTVHVESAPMDLRSLDMFLPFLGVGLSLAPMGLACRVRWSSVLAHARRADLFPAAMRQESISEAMAVLGAAGLTGLIAAVADPATVLRVSAVLSVGVMVLFMAHPSGRTKRLAFTAPLKDGADRVVQARRGSAHRLRRSVTLGCLGLGCLLGSVQGCLLVYAVSLDSAASVGALYASLGLTAAVAAVVVLTRQPHLKLWNQWVVSATATLLTAMMLSMPSGGFGFTVVLALLGVCVGPSLVSLFGLAVHVAPEGLFMGLISHMTAAITAGTGVGLVLSTYYGTQLNYISSALVPVAMALVHMACSLLFLYTWRRSTLSRLHRR